MSKSKFASILNNFTEKQLKHLRTKVLPSSRYNRYFDSTMFYSTIFVSKAELKGFCQWYRLQNNLSYTLIDKKKSEKSEKVNNFSIDEVSFDNSEEYDNPEEYKSTESQLSHSKFYYFNKQKDEYIVHLPSKKRPFILTGEYWRSLIDAYSNWDNQASTINEMCRKFGLARNTLVELLRVMGVTHDSSPWSEEHLENTNEEKLIIDLLRKKEERVLMRSQAKEYTKIQRDAIRYRNYKEYARQIRLMMEGLEPKLRIVEEHETDSNFVVIVSPTDFHWGKHATSYTNDAYNRDIAKKRLMYSTADVLSRIKHRGKPSRIILAIGGDGLHIDNQFKGTTRGTPQDCDGSATELASSYVRLCIEYVEMVKEFAKVQVFVIPGNHDFYTATLLREAIMAWFRNDVNVSINDELSPRQTILYGNSLISFIHGDTGSVKDYPHIIASEKAKLWGKSAYRFIFTGHFHSERELPQFGDTTVYRMPSLAGTDEWHYLKGYKSRKALIGYIIDEDKGVIGTEICPILPS